MVYLSETAYSLYDFLSDIDQLPFFVFKCQYEATL